MRRLVLFALGIVALAACGGSDQRENRLRPPVPVTLTAAIHEDALQVSPATVGAGTVTLLVSNQSGAPQTVTFASDELAERSGNTASSPEIAPGSTGRLTIVTRQGQYSVHTQDEAIRAARVKIGPPRPSAQDRVLLP